MTIGEQIRTRRRQLGLTQAELADRAGVSQAYLSGIETGGRAPREETILAIADAMGCRYERRLTPRRGRRKP